MTNNVFEQEWMRDELWEHLESEFLEVFDEDEIEENIESKGMEGFAKIVQEEFFGDSEQLLNEFVRNFLDCYLEAMLEGGL